MEPVLGTALRPRSEENRHSSPTVMPPRVDPYSRRNSSSSLGMPWDASTMLRDARPHSVSSFWMTRAKGGVLVIRLSRCIRGLSMPRITGPAGTAVSG